MIIANDATVKAGAFFPQTTKKVIRAQRIAFECSLPIIYLVDSAGVFLPMQDEIFPDEDDFGRIFRNNSVISAAGIRNSPRSWATASLAARNLPFSATKFSLPRAAAYILPGRHWSKPALARVSIKKSSAAHACIPKSAAQSISTRKMILLV